MRIWDVEQDKADFAEFYSAARDDCLRIVLVNVGDLNLAEDLVAEGFTRAWMSWRQVREHPAPRAWVVRTAMNAHVSWWRRRRREVSLDDHDVAVAGVQQAGLDATLVTALRRLPVRQREVITLRLLLDLDTDATAEVLGISGGTVASHLHRGLDALRRGIGPPVPRNAAGEQLPSDGDAARGHPTVLGLSGASK